MIIGIDFSINSTAITINENGSYTIFSFVPNDRPKIAAFKGHVAISNIVNIVSYEKEDKHFKARWIVNAEVADKVHQALQDIHDVLKKHDLISEDELIAKVLCHDGICEIEQVHQTDENARRWLHISKQMDKNPLGVFVIIWI
jgi:hypothetical protein